jgi:hypothetical protein
VHMKSVDLTVRRVIERPEIQLACGGASTVGLGRFLWRWNKQRLIYRMVVFDL